MDVWVICAARRDIIVVSCAEVGTKDVDQGKLVGMAWPSVVPRRLWQGNVAWPAGNVTWATFCGLWNIHIRVIQEIPLKSTVWLGD